MMLYASELSDFPELLEATAQTTKISPAIVEKDYFLTRALRALSEVHRGEFVLKGGTGLSKGWQLLGRFSEDIDLLVRRMPDWGNARRDTRLKQLAKTVSCTPGFGPGSTLQASKGTYRIVALGYRSSTKNLSGLSKAVRLEMGYRGNPDAFVTRPVRSMVGHFAASRGQADLADDLSPFDLEIQNLEWTFIEKLFAAHTAYANNRAAGKARHYYDLYRLSTCDEVRGFAGSEDCRECIREVRRISETDFPGQHLPQSLATSPAFQPDPDGLKELEQNYRNEAHLFFVPPPHLEDVLVAIRQLLSFL